MPIYEYRCESCSHEMEKLQRMNDDRLVDCPVCAEPALKRLVSAVAFRLKGSGWYETDFKKDNKRNLADSESAGTDAADKKPAESSSGDGGEKKSADKKETAKAPSAATKESSGKASTA